MIIVSLCGKLVHDEKRGEERRETKHIPSRKTTNYKIELQDNHGITGL